MKKRTGGIRNPDQDPNLADFDPIRRLTGGETPAERIARAEKELRERPLRILGVFREKKRKPSL